MTDDQHNTNPACRLLGGMMNTQKQQIEMIDTGPDEDALVITLEQYGCLAEVRVPGSVIRDAHNALNLKEFLQNSMVDLYARLAYMHRKSGLGQGDQS
jgi:hypothetical protein